MNEMDGVIQGGWGFVGSAYGVVWVVLASYAWSVWSRYRKTRDVAGEATR